MMTTPRARQIALAALLLLAATAMASGLHSAAGYAQSFAAGRVLVNTASHEPLILVQNPSSPFTLPQMPEPLVSPINPGSLPGSTAAIGGSATGTNPITGLPCNGGGSLSISGAGGLPGTATEPPGTNETLDQIPVGAPPVNSIYGSQSSLGSC